MKFLGRGFDRVCLYIIHMKSQIIVNNLKKLRCYFFVQKRKAPPKFNKSIYSSNRSNWECLFQSFYFDQGRRWKKAPKCWKKTLSNFDDSERGLKAKRMPKELKPLLPIWITWYIQILLYCYSGRHLLWSWLMLSFG